MKKISELLINSGDYNQTIHYALLLDSAAQLTNDETAQMYSYIYLGQALVMNGEERKSKYYIDKSLELATKLSNDSALASVYNGLGLYASNVEMDYYRSINYFFQGIEAAKRSSHERLYSILLCNISGIYYLKRDTQGLKYALECYTLGHEKDDAYLIYCGSTNSAYMFFLLGNYDEALKYIKEAEFITEKNNFYDKTNLYNLYGNILFRSGDNKAAIDAFYKALEYKDQSQISSVANTYLSLSKVFIKQKQYKESVALLELGLDLSIKNKNTIHVPELYEYISISYELDRDYNNALKYYKIFQSFSDSIYNAEKERSLSELRIKYDTEKHENEIKQSKLSLLQKEKRFQLLLFAFILIFLILGGTYISYYKKNKLYLQIVKRNKEAIKREANLRMQIDELRNRMGKETGTEKYSVSSMSEEKEIKLYEELTNLMRNEHIYKQNDLTKEKLAALLNTNRTYLSQVINKYSGLSFTHFINSFRIEDAVHVLSDPNNDIPLKALSSDIGFNSTTTFYTAFQSSVGMTPSLYREKVHLLDKQERKRQ
ncbi:MULTISPECIES: AraC family transcriptional regulator [unclassified Dysgonomonas]|uniref:AraC family transcriptional regulator n=1 Tax=unclassified Dysgonomonas TaxID=2630389 RepID=UPI0025C5FC74|nr:MULTISPECIES: AraC family transcriptional regulator [unclassified Dysgonomonas]MDR2005037.1 helix-turn-helix domain-containing protein [Prevotella sp.]HMM02246.1 helix-turn-helix domain-containing protein [Dysgonomonas sp.]